MIYPPITWTFPERSEPRFAEAQSVAVREGNRVGGYLDATILSNAEPLTIGRSKMPIDGKRYQYLQLRMRQEGKGNIWLEANGVPLQTADKEIRISNVFTHYRAELTHAEGWDDQALLELRIRTAAGHPPAKGDRVIIDWMTLSAQPEVSPELPPFRRTSETKALSVHRAWYHEAAGMALIYVHNRSSKPLRLSGVEINGRAENLSVWPPDPERRAHWAACFPQEVPQGGMAEVRISLRDPHPSRPREIAVRMRHTEQSDEERVEVSFSGKQDALEFQDVVWIPGKGVLRCFVRGGEAGDRVTRVLWGGAEITREADLTASVFHSGTAMIDWRPKAPLMPGERRLLEVETERQHYAIRSVRVFPNHFYIGIYGAATPQAFADYTAHGVGHYLSFRNLEPRQLTELAEAGLSGGLQPAGSGVFKPGGYVPLDIPRLEERVAAVQDHPALAYYSLPDEPDIWDYRACEPGAHGRSMIDLAQRHEALDPKHPTFVQLDNTYRSDNYRIYGSTVDMVASHTYLLGQHFFHEDRVGMRELWQCAWPGRLLWVTQFYPLKAEQGEQVAYNGRFPTVEEMHLQMLSALGGGAKGILHYMHSASQGGGGGAGYYRPLWDGMTPLHEQFAAVGAIASAASPVDWPREVTSGLTVDLLSAGKDALLVVVINQQFSSTKEGFLITSVPKGEMKITVPEWWHSGRGKEVLSGGASRPMQWTQDGNLLSISLPPVHTGAIFLLQPTAPNDD